MTQKSIGFTLIEMLLTLAILTLLAGLVLGYSRSSEKTNTLKRMADKLVSDLRRCQSLALSSEGGTGWGIYINSQTSYQIFRDTYKDKDSDNEHKYDDGKDTIISTENLETGIQFEDSNISTSILFFPPLAEVSVDGHDGRGTSIVLDLTGGTATRSITITSFGSISY
jgi:prepilin-type N-terminal cleavage/methylation domain-containing protein